jgi:hypothetical protein
VKTTENVPCNKASFTSSCTPRSSGSFRNEPAILVAVHAAKAVDSTTMIRFCAFLLNSPPPTRSVSRRWRPCSSWPMITPAVGLLRSGCRTLAQDPYSIAEQARAPGVTDSRPSRCLPFEYLGRSFADAHRHAPAREPLHRPPEPRQHLLGARGVGQDARAEFGVMRLRCSRFVNSRVLPSFSRQGIFWELKVDVRRLYHR